MSADFESIGPAAGLFDFQVNGFGGVDFQRDGLTGEELRRAARALRRHGPARILATFITDEVDRLEVRIAGFERLLDEDGETRATIPGYHLEGPWLRPEPGYCGAHPPGPMHAPRIEEFERLQAAARGRIRLVTLAPEWPGSAAFIREIVGRGVRVSLGHTNAGNGEIDAAIAAGARFCTHLGNGTPPALPRHDNIVQRLLARDELTACFIPDGAHLPPFVLRNFVRAKPSGRVLFTTDAMAAAGAPPGRYTLGAMTVDVEADGVPRQPGEEGFAGSALTPDEGVRRTAAYLGWTAAEAARVWAASAAAFGVA
ncbi:MAG: N-acetylglucosamine-6-phosphate deacetylase [Opitutaceae bacterium]